MQSFVKITCFTCINLLCTTSSPGRALSTKSGKTSASNCNGADHRKEPPNDAAIDAEKSALWLKESMESVQGEGKRTLPEFGSSCRIMAVTVTKEEVLQQCGDVCNTGGQRTIVSIERGADPQDAINVRKTSERNRNLNRTH